MIGEALQFGLVAVILGWICFTSWFRGRREGRANPVDTGPLSTQIGEVGARVGKVEAQLDDIEKDVQRLDQDAASKADVKRVEKALTALQLEVADLGRNSAERGATLDHVRADVKRMLDIIVKRGM